MNLKPAEFAALTPGEIDDLRDGYEWRREHELAWLAAVLINGTTHRRFPLTARALVGGKEKTPSDNTTAEERRADFLRLKKQFLKRKAG